MREAEPDQRGLAARYLSGTLRQGRVSIGYKQLAAQREVAPSGPDKRADEADTIAQVRAFQR